MRLIAPDGRHRGFVYGTFCSQVGVPGYRLEHLVEGGARLVVAVSENDEELTYGWGGVIDGRLIWLHVKLHQVHLLDDAKQPGYYDKAIVAELGFDTTKPIPCIFNGPALRAAAYKHGWRLEFEGTDD